MLPSARRQTEGWTEKFGELGSLNAILRTLKQETFIHSVRW